MKAVSALTVYAEPVIRRCVVLCAGPVKCTCTRAGLSMQKKLHAGRWKVSQRAAGGNCRTRMHRCSATLHFVLNMLIKLLLQLYSTLQSFQLTSQLQSLSLLLPSIGMLMTSGPEAPGMLLFAHLLNKWPAGNGSKSSTCACLSAQSCAMTSRNGLSDTQVCQQCMYPSQ